MIDTHDKEYGHGSGARLGEHGGKDDFGLVFKKDDAEPYQCKGKGEEEDMEGIVTPDYEGSPYAESKEGKIGEEFLFDLMDIECE